MSTRNLALGLVLALTLGSPALADRAIDPDGGGAGGWGRSRGYLQCVPYAREVSGIMIRGDAHTWWGQAEGRYQRGYEPRVGAVMAFKPHGGMRLGHVAAVSRIIDSRTVLLRHANWSPINGRRGQIEDNVRAVDVSPAGDWSEVRVWFNPIQDLGGTHWPVQGFIYNRPVRGLNDDVRLARATPRSDDTVKPARASRQADEPTVPARLARSADPIGDIIAARMAPQALAMRSDGRRRD